MSTSQRFLGGAIVISVLVACASGRGASNGTDLQNAEAGTQASSRAGKSKCAPVDSAWLAMPVYRACEVDREAKELGRHRFDFTPSDLSVRCYGASLAYVVDERGAPIAETARVIRSTDSRFSAALLLALPTWRYTPASKDGMPVKQLVEIRHAIQLSVAVTGQPAPRRPSRPTC